MSSRKSTRQQIDTFEFDLKKIKYTDENIKYDDINNKLALKLGLHISTPKSTILKFNKKMLENLQEGQWGQLFDADKRAGVHTAAVHKKDGQHILFCPNDNKFGKAEYEGNYDFFHQYNLIRAPREVARCLHTGTPAGGICNVVANVFQRMTYEEAMAYQKDKTLEELLSHFN